MDTGLLKKQIAALAEEAPQPVPVLSNASALLNEALDDINWVGFYLVCDGALVLGPFQGRPACVCIERGRGICGTALATGEPQLVPDVHEFPGHIACDSASESEIVIPIRAPHTKEAAAGPDHDDRADADNDERSISTGTNAGSVAAANSDTSTGTIVAVLDIDSPRKGRFTEDDLRELTEFVMTLQDVIDWR